MNILQNFVKIQEQNPQMQLEIPPVLGYQTRLSLHAVIHNLNVSPQLDLFDFLLYTTSLHFKGKWDIDSSSYSLQE